MNLLLLLCRLHRSRHIPQILRSFQYGFRLPIVIMSLHPLFQRLEPVRVNLIQKRKVSLYSLSLAPKLPPRCEVLNESHHGLIARNVRSSGEVSGCVRVRLGFGEKVCKGHLDVFCGSAGHFCECLGNVCETDFVGCDFEEETC